MRRLVLLSICSVVLSGPTHAITGDLNRDGIVDYFDLFIFADNFNRTGPPGDADTLYVTVRDTVTIVHPIVGEYETWPDVYEVLDMSAPWEGLHLTDYYHGSDRFRLGPDLSFEEHRFVDVDLFEDGKWVNRRFLKPTGHVISERTRQYDTIEVRQLSDGTLEAVMFEHQYGEIIRYLYDENMNVIDTEFDSTGWGVFGEWYYYYEERKPGTYDSSRAQSRTEIPYSFSGFTGEATFAPIDLDSLLSR